MSECVCANVRGRGSGVAILSHVPNAERKEEGHGPEAGVDLKDTHSLRRGNTSDPTRVSARQARVNLVRENADSAKKQSDCKEAE